jgi:type I restriction enzyme S subunit
VNQGDFLVSRANTAELIGRAVIVEEVPTKLMMSDKIVRLYLSDKCDSKYLWLVNNYSDVSRSHYVRSASGVSPSMKNISRDVILNLPVPLPPLAEQHRIVAKVDELMSLCNQLEAAKADREQCRDSLVAASLQLLNQPAEEEESFREHARFTFNNLPRITTRTAHIKQLRQSILNLAVRGKLVPQDPSDEPAAELLKRISAEKLKQVKERKLRIPKVPLAVSIGDIPADLPATWCICTLGEIALVSDPNPSHRYPSYEGGTVPILSTQEFCGSDGWNTRTAKLVQEDFFKFQLDNCRFSDGDIVFARKGRIGLPRFLPPLEKYTFSHTVFIVKSLDGVLPMYLLWALRREAAVSWLTKEMNQNTGVPTLGKEKTERLPVGLPPIAEQHRIVAKVDELMTICDQLEAQITVTEQDSRHFLESVLADALAPGIDLSAEAQVA